MITTHIFVPIPLPREFENCHTEVIFLATWFQKLLLTKSLIFVWRIHDLYLANKKKQSLSAMIIDIPFGYYIRSELCKPIFRTVQNFSK